MGCLFHQTIISFSTIYFMHLCKPSIFLSAYERLNMQISQARYKNWTLTHNLRHPSQETNPLSIVTSLGSQSITLSNQFRKPNSNPCNLCSQMLRTWLITDSVLHFCPSFQSRTSFRKPDMPPSHPQPITKDALFLLSLPTASLCKQGVPEGFSFFYHKALPLLCLPLSLWLPC